MLTVESLSIRYPHKDLSALTNVSFELPKGAVCLLSGDSGSGQTTLCLALAGILQHARPEATISGSVKWNGNIIGYNDFRPEIAITLENPYAQLSGLKRTVREELAVGLEMRSFSSHKMSRRIELSAEKFGIAHLLNRNPRTLSGGETQRVVIAGSYILNPELWILDRPLNELDPLARHNLLQTINELTKQRGSTVIIAEEPDTDIQSISTHRLTITSDKVLCSLNDLQKHTHIPDLPALSPVMRFTKTACNLSDKDFDSYRAIEVRELGFRYPQSQQMIFDNLSISIDPGECLWITGPNGCGKTTLAKIIAGILRPGKGEVRIDGCDMGSEPLWKIARHVAFAFQNPDLQIFSTNVLDEVSFGPRMLGYSEDRYADLTNYAINLFGLRGLEKVHPHDLNRSQRKRLGLASSFAMDTPIIILDEPTQFQDTSNKGVIKSAIESSLLTGKIILCITHDLDFSGAM